MKDLSDLNPGLRLELILLNEEGEWAGGPYITQLLEPVRNDMTLIANPIHRSLVIQLLPGSSIHLSFVDDKSGLMGFQASVLRAETINDIQVLRLSVTGQLTARQRRTHYRLPICLPFAYRLVSENDEDDQQPFNTAFTKNVSGSGFGVVLNEQLQADDCVEFHLVIDEGRPLRGLAKVIRVTPVKINGTEKYQTGMFTTQLSQRDDDRLYKFIFKQQRILLKKDSSGL